MLYGKKSIGVIRSTVIVGPDGKVAHHWARVKAKGHADAVMQWVDEEARRAGCEELHLDSGVGADREAAHRFYFRHRMRITSYHFARSLGR